MNYYDNNEIMEFDDINQEIKNKILNKKLINIKLNEIKLNDILYICFYPNSQKYIYALTPKYGKVKSINNIEFIDYNDMKKNKLEIIIENYKGDDEDIFHDSVSYMGQSSDNKSIIKYDKIFKEL